MLNRKLSFFCVLIFLTIGCISIKKLDYKNLTNYEGDWIGITEDGDTLFLQLETYTFEVPSNNMSTKLLQGYYTFSGNNELNQEALENMDFNVRAGGYREYEGYQYLDFLVIDRMDKDWEHLHLLIQPDPNSLLWKVGQRERWFINATKAEVDSIKSYSFPSELMLTRVTY